MASVSQQTVVAAPVEQVFERLLDPKHWQIFAPSEIGVSLTEEPKLLKAHSQTKLRIERYGVSSNAVLELEWMERPMRLRYRQRLGWFKTWCLDIELQAHSETETLLFEKLEYQLPFGLLGAFLDDFVIRRDIKALLQQRQRKIVEMYSQA